MAHPIAKNAYSCRCHMGVTNLHGSVPETPPILFNVQLHTHFYPLMCVQFPKGFSIWLRLLVLSDNGGVDQNFPIEMAKKWPWLGVSAPLAIKTTPCQHLVTGGLISSLSRISTGGAWPQLDCKPIFGTSAGKRPGQHFNNGGLGGLPGQLGSHTEVTHEASWPTKTKCAPTCHHYKIQKEPPFISNPLTPNSVLDKFDQNVLLQKAIKSIYSMETAKLNRELKKCTFATIFLCTRHNLLSTLVEDVFSAGLKASLFQNFRIGKHHVYSFAQYSFWLA